jgi:hypothetical protein
LGGTTLLYTSTATRTEVAVSGDSATCIRADASSDSVACGPC